MKRILFFISCGMAALLLTACSVERLKTEKIRDIEFTVVDDADIPKEFAEEICEREKNVFKMTYEDQGYLYVAEGYGRQETSGYSIEVDSVYETENAVYVRTNLIGPTDEEKIASKETFPYIVIKIESVDKNVVFQ